MITKFLRSVCRLFLAQSILAAVVVAAAPRVLPEGKLPNDVRLEPLKDLDGNFPFTPPKQFGYERLRYFQPLRSLFDAGAVAGGGSDHMQKLGSLRSINFYNPFLGMATAITRRAKSYEKPLHPEEALSREQAIRFYTINNARILGCDGQPGSLEPGKLADIIVLDTDLLPVRRTRLPRPRCCGLTSAANWFTGGS